MATAAATGTVLLSALLGLEGSCSSVALTLLSYALAVELSLGKGLWR